MQTRQLGIAISTLPRSALVRGPWVAAAGTGAWAHRATWILFPLFRPLWTSVLTGSIDTAALYGLGHSEEIVALAIRGRVPRPFVFTKCERVGDKDEKIGASLKASSVRRECEDGLRRLRTDVIDLYQIHWPETGRRHRRKAGPSWPILKKKGKSGTLGFPTSACCKCGELNPLHRLLRCNRLIPS
jgi:diketogulonate reductase-like aldo/keto reductase